MAHFFFCPQTLNLLNSICGAQKIKKNISIIVSRNQVDIKKGYLNNFNTRKFIQYVKNLNKNIKICRDHGGIYKRDDEKKLKYVYALKIAKKSFLNDVKLGFDVMHLDTEFFKNRYLDSNDFFKSALKINRNIIFEFGEEKQLKKLNRNELINDINFCLENKKVTRLVTYTGSYLYGLKNVGKFNIKNMRVVNKYIKNTKILIKDHNCDYLSKKKFNIRKKNNINLFNIGPELTHIENKLLSKYGNKYAKLEYKEFKDFVLHGGRWKKWTKSNSSDDEKFLVSAHYYNTDSKYRQLINKINKNCDFNKRTEKVLIKKILDIVKY